MNDFIAKLAIMPWPRVLMIAAAVAAVYFFVGLEEGVSEDTFAAAESRLVQARQSLSDTQKAVSDLKKFREELDNMEAQFKQVIELMPAEVNVADFMLQIREEATKTGARVKRLEPGKEVVKVDFYEIRKLDLALEGSYSQILTFLSNLSKLQRLVTIERLSLSQAANRSLDEAAVSFTGTLVSYRYVAPTTLATPTPAPGGR